ncbi:MAG: hypothetical protein KAS19_06840, partial [Anaerolineales bacterium]|nr:hypothetical protein [Anaerolineales bacterium]
ASIGWQEFGLAGLFGLFAIVVGWRVFAFIDKTQESNGEQRAIERQEFLSHLKDEREQRREVATENQSCIKEVGKSLSDLNVTIQKMNGGG